MGSHKERRLARSGSTLTAAITPMVFSTKELDLTGKAELLPLAYMAHQVTLIGEARTSHHSKSNDI